MVSKQELSHVRSRRYYCVCILCTDTAKDGEITFSMVKVANSIRKEFHLVRSELSNLVNHQPSGAQSANPVSVEFSGQAYHIHTLGNFSREDLRYIKEHLCVKMETQEKRQLEKLYLVHAALCSQSSTSPFDKDDNDGGGNTMLYTEEEEEEEEDKPHLGIMTRQYFRTERGLDRAHLETDFKIPIWPQTEKVTRQQEKSVSNDVQSLVASVRDYKFTGKSASRIFHGIASPRFGHLWGFKNCRFWRKHLRISFDNLCKIANEKLSSM